MELINHIDETICFNEKNIRIIGSYDEPWFVAKDICEILEIKDISMALTKISDKWKGTKVIGTLGGKQDMRIINEAGLYKLIMRSNKPVAQKFQEVVCEDILPSLRKKGEYKIQNINKRLEEELENTNNEKLKLEENNEDLKKKLTKKYNNKKYPEGNCLYVITNKLFPNYYKLGLSKNFNTRLQSYDQLCPKGHTVIYFRLVYCNEEVEKIIKKILCDSVSQTNREEWFELEDKNILLNAVTSICDTIDLFLPRQDGEIVNNNKKRELKNPFLLDTKECFICNLKKPLESFYIAKEHTDGKENSCKECVKIRQKEFIENKRKTEEIPKEKECTNCKKILPLDDYFVDNEKFDRKATKCKICVLEVRNSNKKYLEITEYCCATCNITKHIDLFHKLESSMTGHKYSCKICELKKAKERYNQKREINPENAADDKTEDRKQKQKESYERRINTKIECPCGSVTNLAQQSKHEKTNKHLKYLEI